MNKQAEHYENAGDNLKGDQATRAYSASQNHLQPSDKGYLDDVKRLQGKIIRSMEICENCRYYGDELAGCCGVGNKKPEPCKPTDTCSQFTAEEVCS